MSKTFQRLFAKASNGKIKVWEIVAEKNVMIIRNGYLDGKMAEQKKVIKGVNIGKANETTDEQQCELECQSKWQKKIDQQYSTSMDKAATTEYSEQEILLPMLALNYRDRSHDIVFPCLVQPKLNGVRCIYQNGKFMSRGGKEYTVLDHLEPEVKKFGITNPDGEIYIHGLSLQQLIERVKKDRGSATDEVEYWIYDQVNDDNFSRRTLDIASKFSKVSLDKLKYVPTIEVKSDAEIKKWHDKFLQEGYEGIMIRNMDGGYECKHRSKNLQKYKNFIDEEFEIVGGHESSGADAGTVVFEVKNKKGQVFSVKPKGTREMRTEWFNNIDKLVGKELTVRYQNLSDEGVPLYPRGVAIRDYE